VKLARGRLARRAFAIVGLLVANFAYADKPILVALAPAADARQAVAIGPDGQTYEPDGKGAWLRTHPGGTASTIVAATRVASSVIAGTLDGPPFKLVDGVWSAVFLGKHAKAILGTGSRATASVGRAVFALDRPQPVKLADAPGVVLALAASPTNLVIEIDRGLFRLDAGWKPIQSAPPSVIRFVDDRFALVEHGVFDLRTGKTIAWPADVQVVAASTFGDTLIAAATSGIAVDLLTLRGGKLEREPLAVPISEEIVGVVADREGRVVIASRDGHVAIRDHGTWITATVTDALPAAHPGSPPALSR
jgi:hypothetical protein